MKKVRLLALVLSVVMLFAVLIGCQSKAPDASDTKQPTTEQQTTPDVSTGGEYGNIDWRQFAGDKITLACYAMPISEVYKARLPEFEDLTGIKVNYEIIGSGDLEKALLVDYKSHAGKYDIASVGISAREEYVAGGYLEPLMPYLENPKLTDAAYYNLSDYPADVLEGGKSKAGELVMIPYTAEYFLLWYRQDIFDQLGLKPPTNVDELQTVAKTIDDARKAGKIDTYAFIERTAAGSGEAGWSFFCTANRLNKGLMDFDNNTSLINTEGGKSAVKYYSDLCINYGPEGSGNWGWNDVNNAFSNGLVAMVCGGNAGAPGAADPKNSKVADKVNFAPAPMTKDGKDPLWEWGYGINADSKNKEAAWLFVEWMTSPTLVAKIAPEFGCPARESAYSDPAYIAAMPSQEFINAQLYMMKQGINPTPSLLDAHYGEASDIISRELNNVINGLKDVDTACKDADTQLAALGYKTP